MDVETNRVVIVSGSRYELPSHNKPLPPRGMKIVHKKKTTNTPVSKKSTLCYRISDVVLSLGLILPLVIAFWRGVWQLMDYYSELWQIDPWLSIGTGYSIPFVLYWFQEPLKKIVRPTRRDFGLFYIITRCILLVHSFGSVNQWRGLWKLLDIQTGVYGTDGAYSAACSLVVGVFFSVILKTFCNVLAPPLCVFIDEGNTIHDCQLRFKTSPLHPFYYFLDCLFSVVIVASFVTLCWRGVWNLADIYLYPDDELKSALASLGFGYCLCLIMFLAQPNIYRWKQNLKGFVRWILVDTSTFLQFLGCVFAWRGLWNSYNIFLTFETETMSDWLTTIIGAVGSVIFGCVSTIVVRGVTMDDDDLEDGFTEWSIPYISLLKKRVYDVPFPEPWVCRYLCTSQKMNILKRKGRRQEKDDGGNVISAAKLAKHSDQDGSSTPLRKLNNEARMNSVHPEDNMKARNARFSDLPNIDSSSEEELGMRTSMIPQRIMEVDTSTAFRIQEG